VGDLDLVEEEILLNLAFSTVVPVLVNPIEIDVLVFEGFEIHPPKWNEEGLEFLLAVEEEPRIVRIGVVTEQFVISRDGGESQEGARLALFVEEFEVAPVRTGGVRTLGGARCRVEWISRLGHPSPTSFTLPFGLVVILLLVDLRINACHQLDTLAEIAVSELADGAFRRFDYFLFTWKEDLEGFEVEGGPEFVHDMLDDRPVARRRVFFETDEEHRAILDDPPEYK